MQENVAGIVLSYGYVKEEMTKYAGEDYLDASPLAYGAEGLQFWESKALDDDGEFEINVTYWYRRGRTWRDFSHFGWEIDITGIFGRGMKYRVLPEKKKRRRYM